MKKKENITKAHLSEAVYNKTGYMRKFSADMVNEVFSLIMDTLVKGNGIKIYGFGKFILKEKKARKGRNPQTSQSIVISKRKVVTFHPSGLLKRKFRLK